MDSKTRISSPAAQGSSPVATDAEKLKAALKSSKVALGALSQSYNSTELQLPSPSRQLDSKLDHAEKIKAALADGDVRLSALGLHGGTSVPEGMPVDHHQLDQALEGIGHDNISVLLEDTLVLIEQEIADNERQMNEEPHEQDEAELAAARDDLEHMRAQVQKALEDIRSHRVARSSGAKPSLSGLLALGISLISRTRDVVKRNQDTITRSTAHAGDPVGRAIAEGAAFTAVGAAAATGISFIDPLSWKMSEHAQNFRMVLGALTFGCEHIQDFPAFAMFLEDAADRVRKETNWPPGTAIEQKDEYIRQKVEERWQMLEKDLQDIRQGRKTVADIYQELYNGPADDLLNGKSKPVQQPSFSKGSEIDFAEREKSIRNLGIAAHHLVPNRASAEAVTPLLTLVESGIEPMLAEFLREDMNLMKQQPQTADDAANRLDQLDNIAAQLSAMASPRQGYQLGYSA